MNRNNLNRTPLPHRILALRESSFAADLFIVAVSDFDFFNRLDSSPADIDTICDSLGIQKRPADVMLTLFKSYGFIAEKRGLYYLTDVAREYLSGKSDFNLSSYVSSLKNRPICRDMKNTLLTGRPANWAADEDGSDWATAMEDERFAESFTAGMDSRGAYLAQGMVKVLDLRGYRNILDIGGGSGIYAIVLLENNPHLRAAVFEKPPVDSVAEYAIRKHGLQDRIGVVAGNLFEDSLPAGYDVHLFSHVLHDWNFDKVRIILKNSFDNLEPGGKVIVHDAHINQARKGPVSVAEYSVLLMFMSEGKCYSRGEMKDLLVETGFKDIRHRATIYNRSVITGTK